MSDPVEPVASGVPLSEDSTRLPSPTNDTESPNRTVTDLTAGKTKEETATENPLEKQLREEGKPVHKVSDVLSSLPQSRKNILLLIFCLATFVDTAGVSATFLMTEPIAVDLHMGVNNQAWILGTYAMVFAASLLFAGRLADLYPPHLVFTLGFFGLGILYLIISFMTDEYSFLVLRAVSALLAVCTVPSAINMIVQMYPDPTEQTKKLALLGITGALANTFALILAGVFLLASWRWYFRFITIVIIPLSAASWYLIPRTEAVAEDLPGAEKWKRMDLGGVTILCAALVLFILAFTQAPTAGWNSAIFIAPLVLSVVLFPVFLFWEQKMPHGFALLPHDIWQFPNIFPLILQASAIFMWYGTSQLRLATYFQAGLGNSAILAAVKLLPMGITALFVGGAIQAVPTLITRPRYVQVVASALAFAGSMLFAYSNGGGGKDYWRFLFPGQIIGTVGAMLVFVGMNTSIIQSFPLEFAGIGGSFVQIVFQVGAVIGISVQQGLLATGDGTLKDFEGTKNGFFFSSGYILFTGIMFVIFYRQDKMPEPPQPPQGENATEAV